MRELFFAKTVNSLKPFAIFTKKIIIDIWHGSKYISELLKYICYYYTDGNTSFPSSAIQVKY